MSGLTKQLVLIRRYRTSECLYLEFLPEIEYGLDNQVVTVGWDGNVVFKGRSFRLSTALLKLPNAFRPVPGQEGLYHAYFCHQRIMKAEFRQAPASV